MPHAELAQYVESARACEEEALRALTRPFGERLKDAAVEIAAEGTLRRLRVSVLASKPPGFLRLR